MQKMQKQKPAMEETGTHPLKPKYNNEQAERR